MATSTRSRCLQTNTKTTWVWTWWTWTATECTPSTKIMRMDLFLRTTNHLCIRGSSNLLVLISNTHLINWWTETRDHIQPSQSTTSSKPIKKSLTSMETNQKIKLINNRWMLEVNHQASPTTLGQRLILQALVTKRTPHLVSINNTIAFMERI